MYMKNNFFDINTVNRIEEFFKEKYEFLFKDVFDNILNEFDIKNPKLIDLETNDSIFVLDFFDQPQRNLGEKFLNIIGIEDVPLKKYQVLYNKNYPEYILLIVYENDKKTFKAYYNLAKDNTMIKKFDVDDRKTARSKVFKYSFKNQNKYQYTYKFKDNNYKILFDLNIPFELENLFITKLLGFRKEISGVDFKDLLIITLRQIEKESNQEDMNSFINNIEIAYHEEYNLFLIRSKYLKKERNNNQEVESHKKR